jgi:hypothetical protein
MARGKRITQDQHFQNGSIVLWSQRFEKDGYYYVRVQCEVCHEIRTVAASGVHDDFSGLCSECSRSAKRTLVHTGEQLLPNGSVIFWDNESYDERYATKRRFVTVRCGGNYCGNSTRQVPVHIAAHPDFTGLCRRCAHFGIASGRWKGGRKKNAQGYILVKVTPDHPFFCMADQNGYILAHRLVIAEKIGRPLRSDEIVHHLNRNKQDNRPENLKLLVEHHHAGYDPVIPAENTPTLLAWLKRIVRK